ncbi:MAG: PTS sugar transporter subunit IIA [Fibrobacter sp.]|nr:PTS sugar transporter subunit IIA [Fibrobacter sp.]
MLNEKAVCFLDASKKEAAIEAIVDKAVENCPISDPKGFKKALLEREKLISTGIGLGIAIPHAKLDSIDKFFLQIGILAKPIDWDAIDSIPVKVVILIGGPSNRQTEYLQILSRLMLLIKNKSRREKLFAARTAEDVLSKFRKF